MATQFYLTLPSNSSMAYFPNNTVANFSVKLAETIGLPGQWEVALVGLHCPHTWPTIKKGVQQTFLYNLGADLKDETAVLKDVYYPSLEQLIKALNASMSKEAQAKIKFSYNPSSRKVTVGLMLLLRMMFKTVKRKTLFSSISSVPKTMENTFQTFVWHRTKAARNSCFLAGAPKTNFASGSLKIKTQTLRLSLTISRPMMDISSCNTCTKMASLQRSLLVVQKFFSLLFQK